MADENEDKIKTSSDIPTDIPKEPPTYPGKPLGQPHVPLQRTSVVEVKSGQQPNKLASENNFTPVASIKFPNKNIHVLPLKNTNSRGVTPVAMSSSVTLPIRGENVFDLDESIRRPLEKRLGRLLENTTLQKAGSSGQIQKFASQQSNPNTEYVKTELDKLRDLARQELAKKQDQSPLQIKPLNTTMASVVGEQKPPQAGDALLPKQPPPSSPSAAQEVGGPPTTKLLSEAQQLEEELKALQQNLATSTNPQPAPQAIAQDPNVIQINQLLKDKTDLLNKVNELATAYQQAETLRKKTEEKLYALTNEFNLKLLEIKKERDSLQKQVSEIAQRQTRQPQPQVHQSEAPTTQTALMQQQLMAAETDKKTMRSQIQKLEVLIQQLGGKETDSAQQKQVIRPKEASPQTEVSRARIIKPQIAVGRMAPALTTAPNVVSGIIKDSKGMLLSNVIIVVKGENGDPVRALKSNKIGQFAISTPLPNGTYTMELESPAHTFDLIQVDIKGKVMPPIEIRSHN